MIKKELVAHELGHAIAAAVQDTHWYSSGLEFNVKGTENTAMAYCYCERKKTKKVNIRGPYSKMHGMMSLGGVFGELLISGQWHPWSARSDLDEFITENERSKSKIKIELDDWMWIDDDKLSFRKCAKGENHKLRRAFTMDPHDTCRRLPNLWNAYLDFCDRIDKEIFEEHCESISKKGPSVIDDKKLKAIIKDIIL